MNLGNVLLTLASYAVGFAAVVFMILLALIWAHGKPSKEDSFTDLLKKLSFTELGMAFGVGAGVFIGATLNSIDFGLISYGLGIIISAAIGLFLGKVLDAQKARKSLKKA